MNRHGLVPFVLLLLILSCAETALADPIELFQSIFNVDGTLYDSTGLLGSSVLPSGFSLTPSATGAQGLLTVSLAGAGTHSFAGFYDYELDQNVNGFSNEFGSVANLAAKPTGLTWEIDEPGFVFGNIYDHIQSGASSLDNLNSVPSGLPDDPAVALGWQFSLLDGQSALISLLVSETVPTSGFYLAQFDPLSGTGLYYSTSLAISGAPAPVPEPGTLVLLLTGLVVAGAARKMKRDS